MACSPEHAKDKLVPWAGAAARLAQRVQRIRFSDSDQARDGAPWLYGDGLLSTVLSLCGDLPRATTDPGGELLERTHAPEAGRVYCFLPLPISAGNLSVSVNGLFELSANRRDLWWTTQNDMTGDGRRRAQWNAVLLADVVAPSFGRLLLEFSRLLTSEKDPSAVGTSSPQPVSRAPTTYQLAHLFSLWPSGVPSEPWTTVVVRLFSLLRDVAVLYTPLSAPSEVQRWRAIRASLSSVLAGEKPCVPLDFRGAPVLEAHAAGEGCWVSPADAVVALAPALDIFGTHGNARAIFGPEHAPEPAGATPRSQASVGSASPPDSNSPALVVPVGSAAASEVPSAVQAAAAMAQQALSSLSTWAAFGVASAAVRSAPAVVTKEAPPPAPKAPPALDAPPRTLELARVPAPLTFADEPPSATVMAALTSCGVPVVAVPPSLRSMLLSSRVSTFEVSPGFVRAFFRLADPVAIGLFGSQEAAASASVRRALPCLASAPTTAELLRYALSDLDLRNGTGPAGGTRDCHGLPLLTSSTGALLPLLAASQSGQGSETASAAEQIAWLTRAGVFLLQTPIEWALWSTCAPHRVLVSPSAAASPATTVILSEDSVQLLRSDAVQRALNVRIMKPELLGALCELALPAGWLGRAHVAWQVATDAPPTVRWIASLWQYLDAASPRLECLSESFPWPIVPAFREQQSTDSDGSANVSRSPAMLRYLLTPSTTASLLDGSSLSPSVRQALSAAGVFFLDLATVNGIEASTEDGGPRTVPPGLLSRTFAQQGTGRGLVIALRNAVARMAQTPASSQGGLPPDYEGDLKSFLPRLFCDAPPHVRDELRRLLSDGLAPEGAALARNKGGSGGGAWHWRTGEALTDLDILTLKSLPIYEVFDGGPGSDPRPRVFADFLEPLVLPPAGVPVSLLTRAFLRLSPDDVLLARACGATSIDEVMFYESFVLPVLGTMSTAVRDVAVEALLTNMERIDAATRAAAAAAEATLAVATTSRDSRAAAAATAALQRAVSLSSVLRLAAFVPDGRGVLKRASELYDPSVPELRELLGSSDAFPSAAWDVHGGAAPATGKVVSLRTVDVLAALRRLGLQCRLSRAALLQAARTLDAQAGSSEPGLALRAQHLLRLVNDLAIDAPWGRGLPAAAPGVSSESAESADAVPIVDIDPAVDASFMAAMKTLAWMPTLGAAPHPLLPWRAQNARLLLPPTLVRPPDAAWLCSCEFGLLDGSLQNAAVRQWFGWEAPAAGAAAGTASNFRVAPAAVLIAPQVVARQLVAIASKCAAMPPGDAARTLGVFVPPLYTHLVDGLKADRAAPADAENVNRAEASAVARLLRDVPWVFVGDRFVASSRVALRCPAHAHPILHALPPELVPLLPMLRLLGVREAFSLGDLAAALRELPRGQALPAELLAFAAATVDLLGAEPAERDVAGSERAPAAAPDAAVAYVPSDELARGSVWWREAVAAAGVVFIPDAGGVMRPSTELIVNDAPWLPRAAVAVHASRFIHRSVHAKQALNVGAQSLRALVLREQAGATTLPFPGAAMVGAVLERHSEWQHIFSDVFEVAEFLGCASLSVVWDAHSYPGSSLLHPSLAALQGPALLFALHGVALSPEQLLALTNPTRVWTDAPLAGPPVRGPAALGPGLLSAFHVTDCMQVLTPTQLLLADPARAFFPTGEGRGAAAAQPQALSSFDGVCKGFPLATATGGGAGVQERLRDRFPDQLAPFAAVEQTLTSFKGTIIRLPLRTAATAWDHREAGAATPSSSLIPGAATVFAVAAAAADEPNAAGGAPLARGTPALPGPRTFDVDDARAADRASSRTVDGLVRVAGSAAAAALGGHWPPGGDALDDDPVAGRASLLLRGTAALVQPSLLFSLSVDQVALWLLPARPPSAAAAAPPDAGDVPAKLAGAGADARQPPVLLVSAQLRDAATHRATRRKLARDLEWKKPKVRRVCPSHSQACLPPISHPPRSPAALLALHPRPREHGARDRGGGALLRGRRSPAATAAARVPARAATRVLHRPLPRPQRARLQPPVRLGAQQSRPRLRRQRAAGVRGSPGGAVCAPPATG